MYPVLTRIQIFPVLALHTRVAFAIKFGVVKLSENQRIYKCMFIKGYDIDIYTYAVVKNLTNYI